MVAGLVITGCVDNNFDEPENTLTINPDEVMSISDVMALLPSTGGVVFDDSNIGTENKYIKGTVTADDASGNFFKTVTFEDETGALSIAADRNELNAEFPEGNIIYVKLNGLTLGDDAGLPRIGYSIEDDRLQRIPDLLVNDFMIAGGIGESIVPVVVTIEDILKNSNLYYNKLVTLEQAQFTLAYAGQTFADPDNPEGPESVNAMIEDCEGDQIILRNSGFADFAAEITPFGSGKVTGVVGVFLDDLQMFIRDLNDLEFMEERCDGSGGQASNEIEIETIQQRFYESGADAAQTGFITGTVISDRNSGQVNSQNIFVQNDDRGILVRFSSEHNFDLGDAVKITVSGQEVSEFRGLLQINNVPLFSAQKTGVNELPEAKEISVDEILLDNNRYESTRVLIKGATLSGGSTYGVGSISVDDGTESINIFTFSTSSYANDPVPSGVVDVTAIVSQYDDDAQLVINASTDVVGGTIDPGGSGDELSIQSIQDRFYDFGADSAEEGFITGTVISDRNSGQVNEQNVVVQNDDRGILVRFTDAHNFDLGETIKVTVSNQEVSEFRGLLQINNVPLANASSTGTSSLPTPKQITIDEILLDNNRYESTRVLITGAMLSGGSTYGVGNITVDDGTETIDIFTFSSSSYANDPVPTGTVNVTAFVSQFEEDAQLLINSASDVSGGTIDPGGDSTLDESFVGEFRESIAIDGWMNIATKGTRTWYYSNFGDENFAECEGYQDPEPETEAWLITPTLDTDQNSMFSFESQKAFWQHQGLSVWISQDFSDFEDANWISLDQAVIADDTYENFVWVSSGTVDLKDYLSGKVRVAFKYEGTAAENTTKMRIDNVQLK